MTRGPGGLQGWCIDCGGVAMFGVDDLPERRMILAADMNPGKKTMTDEASIHTL